MFFKAGFLIQKYSQETLTVSPLNKEKNNFNYYKTNFPNQFWVNFCFGFL